MDGSPTIVLLHGVQSSTSTWWRVAPDLRDLGCRVLALDLPGHGSRPASRALSLTSMAEDVATQLGGRRVDLAVGHSMGALVGLTLAAARPGLLGRLVLEDPPALGPELDPADVAAGLESQRARADREPERMKVEMAARNPMWASPDVANDLANLRSLDVPAVTSWLRSERWDLVELVRACPVPVHLLVAAQPTSATTRPARDALFGLLGTERITEVVSSHSIHRDRPGIWVATVLTMLLDRSAQSHRPSGRR